MLDPDILFNPHNTDKTFYKVMIFAPLSGFGAPEKSCLRGDPLLAVCQVATVYDAKNHKTSTLAATLPFQHTFLRTQEYQDGASLPKRSPIDFI